MIRFHPQALERMSERGATERQVIAAVESGEAFPAKFGRTGFRRNFVFDGVWRGISYHTIQVEAYAVEDAEGWLVITVITRYF